MKIVSKAAAVTAMLFGIGAFMHPATVKAAVPPGYCPTLYAACQHGDANACTLYKSVCSARSPGAVAIGTPMANGDGKPDTAMLNSNRAVIAPR